MRPRVGVNEVASAFEEQENYRVLSCPYPDEVGLMMLAQRC